MVIRGEHHPSGWGPGPCPLHGIASNLPDPCLTRKASSPLPLHTEEGGVGQQTTDNMASESSNPQGPETLKYNRNLHCLTLAFVKCLPLLLSHLGLQSRELEGTIPLVSRKARSGWQMDLLKRTQLTRDASLPSRALVRGPCI